MLSIPVPPLGESIVEATVGRWLKQEGEAVAAGEPLVELETDKINVEVPAPAAGVLTKRLVQEGDTVAVDQPLAQIEESAAAPSSAAAAARTTAATAGAPSPGAPSSGAPSTAQPAAAPRAAPPAATTAPGAPVQTSPAVRRIAAETGISPDAVRGTGRGGRVTKGDMLAAAAQPASAAPQAAPAAAGETAPAAAPSAAAPQPAAPPRPAPPRSANGERETREKMTTRRRRIAEHLLEAQHATAHLTTFNEVDMSAVMALRERLRERVEKEHGVKLTYLPFFARAAAMALRAHPAINAQVDGDTIVYRHYVNMGIAVASDQGLVVPVVHDADRLGMLDFSRALATVATRAREGKLTMEDLTGGTFTITNGGVFGSLVSTPILNYPQSGILGLHKIQERPVAVAGRVEIRPMMYLALSYDHRIVEGQHAVLFLVRVKELMEDPAAMLVD